MKKARKLLSLLLAVAMTLSIMSVGVLASAESTTPDTAAEQTSTGLTGTGSTLSDLLKDLLNGGIQAQKDLIAKLKEAFTSGNTQAKTLIEELLNNAKLDDATKKAISDALANLDPANLAKSLSDLNSANIAKLIDAVKNNDAALKNVLSSLDPAKLADALKQLTPTDLSTVLGDLSPENMAGILKTLNDDAITNLLNVISGNTDATAKLAQALGTLNTTNIENLLKLLQNNNEAFQTVLNNLPSAKLADLLKNFNSADLPSVIENLSPANLTKALEDMTASNVAALMDVLKGNTDAMNALVKNLPSSRLAEALKTFNEDNLNALLNVLNSDNMAKVLDNLSATSLANALKALDNGNLAKILDNMSATKLAEALKSLAPVDLNNLVNQFSPAKLAEILKNLDTTSLADLLKTLSTNKLNGLRALISAMDPQKLLTALETLKAENIDAFKALLNSDALTAIMKNLTSGQLVDALAAANKDNIQALMDVLTGNSVLAKNLLLALKELNAQSLENLLNLLSKSEIGQLLSKLGISGIEDILKNLSDNDIISLLKNLFAKGFSFDEISTFLKNLINGSTNSSFISRIKAILDKLKTLLTGSTDISDDKTPLADAGMLNSTDHIAYVSGYPNGTFRPTGRLTRAEAAQMLYNLLTDTARTMYSSSSNSFSDVSADKWYNTPVSTLTSAGAINGYANGTYRPAQNITRAEFTKILVAMYGVDSTATCSYNDVSSSNWAYQYIATAAKLGWIAGYSDGSFKPGQPITRAETVTILNRVLSRSFDTSFTGSVRTFADVQRGLWYYNDVMEAANGHTYTRTGTVETWTALK